MTGSSLHRADRRGFTLIELLIALAASAIILVAIHETFFAALRLHSSTHEAVARDLELGRASSLLRRDFEGVLLPGGTLSGQFQTAPTLTTFDSPPGDRLSPDLYTTSAAVDGWSSLSEVQRVAYFLAPDPDATASGAKRLIRAFDRNLLPAQPPVAQNQVLLGDISSAEMTFFDGTTWQTAWDSSTSSTLPSAVKLHLTLGASDPNRSTSYIEWIFPILTKTRTSTANSATGSSS